MTAKSHEKLELASRAENTLFGVCLVMLALGAVIPQRLAAVTPINFVFGETLYAAISAGIMIFASIGWMLWIMRRSGKGFELTGIEPGIAALVIAGLVGVMIAGDKRSALNHFMFIIAPIFMAILLIQLLSCASRVKILLYIIVAAGLINVYQCADQRFYSNQKMLDQYQSNPEEMLAVFGTSPGTFEAELFHHHIHSQDVRGFFTTSNSAASFTIIALMAALALIAQSYRDMRAGVVSSGSLAGKCIAAIFLVWGLWLTQSRGGIAAAAIGVTMLLIWTFARNWLWRRRKFVCISAVLLLVVAVAAIVWYGTTHDTLPGGKSMMVRWQYWVGSIEMYRENPFGVGGANFGLHYTRHKIPAAPETVQDPHNWPLSLLTQYGPLGLAGFLAAIIGPLGMAIFGRRVQMPDGLSHGRDFAPLAIKMMLAVAAAMLLVRPLLLGISSAGNPIEIAAMLLLVVLLPALIFIAAMVLISLKEQALKPGSPMVAALFCGIVAVLIHNTIDFAFFEPGVMYAFWSLVAAVLSIGYIRGELPERRTHFSGGTLIGASILALLAAWAYTHWVVIADARAQWNISSARIAAYDGRYQEAYGLLAKAAHADILNSQPSYIQGVQHLREYQAAGAADHVFTSASEHLQYAIRRNPIDYRSHARLAELHMAAAAVTTDNIRTDHLRSAAAAQSEAIRLYPGNAEFHITMGDIAEMSGQTEQAIASYRRAIAIEDDYRAMFHQMYKNRELFSRLGEEKYQYCRSRILELGASLD